MEPDDGTNKRRGSLSYHNEDCTVIRDTAEWNDINCNDRHMFICKKPIVKPGAKDVQWRPVYADSMVKLNQNIPFEEFTEKQSCAETKSSVCTTTTSSLNKQDAEDVAVMPGGNGGSSKIHFTNDIDEQETLTTGEALIRVPQPSSRHHEEESTAESHDKVSLKSGKSENLQHQQEETLSKLSNSVKDDEAVMALNKAVQEIEKEHQKQKQKDLTAMDSINHLVDDLKNQYNKQSESSGNNLHHEIGISIDQPQTTISSDADAGEVRKKIWSFMNKMKIPTSMDQEHAVQPLSFPTIQPNAVFDNQHRAGSSSIDFVNTEISKQPSSPMLSIEHSTPLSFKPNSKTIETICKQSCKVDIDGCMESCRGAVNAMSPVEFLHTLQSLNPAGISGFSNVSGRVESGERREANKVFSNELKDFSDTSKDNNILMEKSKHSTEEEFNNMVTTSSHDREDTRNDFGSYTAADVKAKNNELDTKKDLHNDEVEPLQSSNDHKARRREHHKKKHRHELILEEDSINDKVSTEKGFPFSDSTREGDKLAVEHDNAKITDESSSDGDGDVTKSFHQVGSVKDWESQSPVNLGKSGPFESRQENSYFEQNDFAKDFLKNKNSYGDLLNDHKNREKEENEHISKMMKFEEKDTLLPTNSDYQGSHVDEFNGKTRLEKNPKNLFTHNDLTDNSLSPQDSSLKDSKEFEHSRLPSYMKDGNSGLSNIYDHHKLSSSTKEGRESDRFQGMIGDDGGLQKPSHAPLNIHIKSIGRDEFPQDSRSYEDVHFSSIDEALSSHSRDSSREDFFQNSNELTDHFHKSHAGSNTDNDAIDGYRYPAIKHDIQSGDSFPAREFNQKESVDVREIEESQIRENENSSTRENDNSRINHFSSDAPVVELHLGNIEKDNAQGSSVDSSIHKKKQHQLVTNMKNIFDDEALSAKLRHRRLEKHLFDMNDNDNQINHLVKQDLSSGGHDILAPPQEKHNSRKRSRKQKNQHENEMERERVAKAKDLIMEFKKLRNQLKDKYHSLSNKHFNYHGN